MNPVTPTLHVGGSLVIFARDQPQYLQLPASVDIEGTVMTEWELTAEELATLMNGGRIRLWLLYTGVQKKIPLTPIRLEVIESHDPQDSPNSAA